MTPSSGESPAPPTPLPTAIVQPRATRRGLIPRTVPWLIPALAAIVALVLVLQAIASRGPRVDLLFASGHGIRPNDPIIHRGIQVGRVHEVTLDPSTHQVRVIAELTREAAHLSRGGQFWIVRPEVSLSRVSGLETLLGPRYIAAERVPEAEATFATRTFESPPVPTPDSLPGLNLILQATRSGSLSIGAPVSYRELPVGSVTNLLFAPDARTVNIHINIKPEYAHFVRTNTRFWNTSGIGLDVGLIGGLKLKAESLQTIFAGGLAFATPDKPADLAPPAENGRTFPVEDFDDSWLKWSPDLTPKP